MEAMRPEWSKDELPLPDPERQEFSIEAVDEEPQALSFAEGLIATKALEKQPVVAEGIVSKAAEEGRPKEKELEERHEKVGSLDVAQAASSVGSILEQRPPAPQLRQSILPSRQEPRNQQAAPYTEEKPPLPSYPLRTSLYHQAVRVGFAAALLLILVVVLSRAVINMMG